MLLDLWFGVINLGSFQSILISNILFYLFLLGIHNLYVTYFVIFPWFLNILFYLIIFFVFHFNLYIFQVIDFQAPGSKFLTMPVCGRQSFFAGVCSVVHFLLSASWSPISVLMSCLFSTTRFFRILVTTPLNSPFGHSDSCHL